MSNNTLKDNYNKLNNSFEKTLVFRIGIEAGFFSEYNNMIFAMLYCLKHRIRFTLYSENANFGNGISNNWQSLFNSFCPEVTEKLHSRFNYRFNYRQITWRTCFYYLFKAKTSQVIKCKLSQTFLDPFVNLARYKKQYNFDFFTFELWNEIQKDITKKNQNFSIPELNIEGGTLEACKRLIEITWQYNETTKTLVESQKMLSNIESPYYALHIRGGDKFLEHTILPTTEYLHKLKILTNKKKPGNIFVLTDDYRVIQTLKAELPTTTVSTLCKTVERGYFHQQFIKLSTQEQASELIKLFASIDIICMSQLFVGTINSNPGMYVKMRMCDTAFGIDTDNWLNNE